LHLSSFYAKHKIQDNRSPSATKNSMFYVSPSNCHNSKSKFYRTTDANN